MDSRYSPQDIEAKWYATWEKAGSFEPRGQGKPFTIVIPPPNVTGALHMGHALNNTLQDVLIRFKRLQGYRTLWQPGTDHAGIATQSVVERTLQKDGKSKHDLGREKFIEHVWAWKNEYGGRIVEQLKRLGCSCDWSRLRFTMDDGLSKAVREVFVRLHEDGLIYRGARLVNWCPKLQTALADEEVENKESKGHFWSIRYPLEGNPGEGIVVATTRPETLFGDVAVAVHAEDERYKHLIGKRVLIPIINRAIPIIADEHADPTKGTGAVKITPAHDFNDFEVGQRHQLKPIVAMNLDATLNHEAGPYAGMERFAARKKLVAELEEKGLLVSVEDRLINIPYCYRSGDVVEPSLLSQWYVKMRPLAEPALACVDRGDTRFVPERYVKTYRQWLEPFRDWCISRQLWWGHQIPVWYVISETGGKVLDSTPHIAARSEKDARKQAVAKFGPDCTLKQEEDVLDTWFSSALWPFSTLGWPDETPDLKAFYPTDVLVTARDIIYFWVARMIFSGLKFMGPAPFHTVYIHGTILDEKGQRMSKSKGNGIDPIEMIGQFGADAVRFALLTLTTEGQDIKLSPVKFEGGRNFANKLWNAVRFVHPHLSSAAPSLEGLELSLADRWILKRCDETVREVAEALEPPNLRFSDAAQALYRFTWDDFCSRYLEIRKKDITGEDGPAKRAATTVFRAVLRDLIAILHPFMPYITEEIHSHLGETDLLVTGQWPKSRQVEFSAAEQKTMDGLIAIVEAVRQIRGGYSLPPQQALDVRVQMDSKDSVAALLPQQSIILGLEKIGNLEIGSGIVKPSFAASTLIPGGKVYVPLEGLLDPNAERLRLGKELEKAKSFVVTQENKLRNEKFVQGAPADVVEGEREKLRSQINKVAKLEEALRDLG
ncbi:MAG TPA: valine--tRNA ligase [Fibrobacteres bacterium]|jgi:valyl-tRNA synthetase|nr:valine--tRNA ligase [Fibrobacterota bacterium]